MSVMTPTYGPDLDRDVDPDDEVTGKVATDRDSCDRQGGAPIVAEEPTYRRVANELRERIASGDLPEGSPVPSLREIAQAYDVNRGVAEQALTVLRSEGWISSRQGARSVVKRFERIVRKSPGRLSRNWWGADHMIQDHDTEGRFRVVDVRVGDVPAPDYVAAALEIELGARVLSRSRRFLVEDRPVQLATSYLPVAVVRGSQIEHTDTGPGGIYRRLHEMGFGPTRFVENVISRAPTPAEAEQLELNGGSRIFQITRFAYSATTTSERCVEVNRMILDAAAYELSYGFPA